MTDQDPALTRLIKFFENISLQDCSRKAEIYSEDATFKDPFNQVVGVEKIAPIYAEMFEVMHDPRFRIATAVKQGNNAFLTWDYTFRLKKFQPEVTQHIHGASHFVLAGDGRIAVHRDYWDPAESLYAKLPIIGALMRFLQKKFAHHHDSFF
jgi:steroid Delta-isomerase